MTPKGGEEDEATEETFFLLGETLIRRRDLAARIREELGRIDELDRASFILRDVEQLTVDEVAAILRTSPEEIRQRAHRARLMLARFFARLLNSPTGKSAARPHSGKEASRS
jgi:DNA-directed RNA polymerase specialized sigma24 family protein